MCGFSAYFHFDSSVDQPLEYALDASLQQIRHRGPDSNGKYISDCGRCGLGHVRLSINDLDGGYQPISDQTETLYTVVNGELYDFERIRAEYVARGYSFKTKSDSEIVLPLYQEYGLSFLEHLTGEFAFCMHDTKRNQLIVARDRFGIKPVYYTIQNGALLVASEIKAFLPMGWIPEWDMDSVVNNGTMLDYRTCFKGVQKLPPGHYMIARSSGHLDIQPYWTPDYPDRNVTDNRSHEEMIQGVQDRLVESIRLRMHADVPVGVYLSGGIDSSSVACIASKLVKDKNPDAKITAFSIAFEGGDGFDESEVAERTANSIGANFEKVIVKESDILDNLEECVWHAEASLLNLCCVGKYVLSKYVHDKGYKSVMSGEGSDEHFAGYSFLAQDVLPKRPENVENSVAVKKVAAADFSDKKKTDDEMIKSVACLKMTNNARGYALFADFMSTERDFYTDQVVRTYGLPDFPATAVEAVDGLARANFNKKWHPLHVSLYIHSRVLLGNTLCGAVGDRSEMAHSVEGRNPFLDHVLCEYVNGLPHSVKLKVEEDGSLNEKWVLKEAVKSYIPREIYERTKQPFLAPVPKVVSPEIVNCLNKWITKENVDRLGWANFEAADSAKEEFFQTLNTTLFDDLIKLICYVILSHQFNVTKYSDQKHLESTQIVR